MIACNLYDRGPLRRSRCVDTRVRPHGPIMVVPSRSGNPSSLAHEAFQVAAGLGTLRCHSQHFGVRWGRMREHVVAPAAAAPFLACQQRSPCNFSLADLEYRVLIVQRFLRVLPAVHPLAWMLRAELPAQVPWRDPGGALKLAVKLLGKCRLGRLP